MGRSKDWNFTPQATTFLRFCNCCQENVTTLCCVTVLTLAFGISGIDWYRLFVHEINKLVTRIV